MTAFWPWVGASIFVKALFEGLARPVHSRVTGPAGSAHEPAINFLRATFRSGTLAEWQEWFEGRDICWSPVLDLQEAWSADHV